MAKSRRTERILVIFHFLKRCKEVSYKEVNDEIPVSKKTVYRDIRFLRDAGFRISFSMSPKSYVMYPGKDPPKLPENKAARRYMGRILRLIDMMCEMEGADDPAAWYREKYPNLSVRTMRRDFKILNSIGYRVEYARGWDIWEERQPRKYYCEWPTGTYDPYVFELFKRQR